MRRRGGRRAQLIELGSQVSRCQAKLKRSLTDADYTARHKFSFDMCVGPFFEGVGS